MDEILKNILGKNAFESNNFQVDNDVAKLVKAIKYIQTQMELNFRHDKECKEISDNIIFNAEQILKDK